MSKITNKSLAEKGRKSYQWARDNMPALVTTINKTAEEFSFKGTKIAVCLHVTKETSVLVMGLKELGADVYLSGANPLSTQDDIAAYLDSEGVNVFPVRVGAHEGDSFSLACAAPVKSPIKSNGCWLGTT